MKAVELPHDSSSLKCSVYFAVKAKEWQNSLRLFCRFGHYFALVGKIGVISFTCECSCILCPNVENFCLNNGQFFSIGDATASLASPCRTLMLSSIRQLVL